ncbi:MAG: hypothetical protein Ct9H90mP8_3730 [Pseudomonadota bacterium]|nr:MAG: hypothetical protein Ct9H90mP8_3730 [Pseudomonadota bacterium]
MILLDELDKMGQSYRGDPLSVLLEVLDPEQNREFMDHYLDLHYDLSNVLFIATANVLDTIPPALKDRLEIINLSGYINEEKIQIGTKYLIPKVLEESGLNKEQFRLPKKTLEKLIQEYTRETGVRGLEKQLKALSRGVALKVAKGEKSSKTVNRGSQIIARPLFPERCLKSPEHPG